MIFSLRMANLRIPELDGFFWLNSLSTIKSNFPIQLFLATFFLMIFLLYSNVRWTENYTTPVPPVPTYSAEELLQLCSVRKAQNCPKIFSGFKNMEFKFVEARRYGLGSCLIEKSMSTLMTAIFCYLHDDEAFIKANRSIRNELYHIRFCKGKNEYKYPTKRHPNISSLSTITVVRDPIERFLSGFTEKCINEMKERPYVCFRCKGNLKCFIKALYQNFMKRSANGTIASNYEEVHFSPQNWYCNFRSRLYKYTVIKYGAHGEENERMVSELSKYFLQKKVPKKLVHQISEQISGGKTLPTTRGSNSRDLLNKELRENPDLMLTLVKIYYYDFILFGFDFPSINK